MQKAFSSEHQNNLETLQKLVAQVESWTAEVQQMSEATRADKEKMVTGKERFRGLYKPSSKHGQCTNLCGSTH